MDFSGKQSTLFEKDGKYYAVKGTKITVGAGVSSSDQKVMKIDKKGIAKAGKSGTTTLNSPIYGNVEVTIVSPSLSEKNITMSVGDKKEIEDSTLYLTGVHYLLQ